MADKFQEQSEVLEMTVKDLEKVNSELVMHNETLQKRVEELEQIKDSMEQKVDALQQRVGHLQTLVDQLHGSKTVEPTHRNILYSEEKGKKRLPVLKAPVRGADEVGSLVFGECFAVSDQKADGEDLWLQIRGGDFPKHWVLGCDAGTVNCVDMTKYDREKYNTRIQSKEYRGQNFPKKMYTEGFAGSSDSHVCLVSASGDSFWREVNIEMLLRGIATATVFEEAWGGDETFTDWVAYYAVNCVQYGQLRTPLQKHLKVTVKPTSRWREFQAGSCLGPDLDQVRSDIGKAQYKECCWLKCMKDQLHVKWEQVEFLTVFAFLRAHCAWTLDDCKEAANDRFMWVIQEFFAGGKNEKASYELERAYWIWDEAFDGCSFDKEARAKDYALLRRSAERGSRVDMPCGFCVAGAAPLAWGGLLPAFFDTVSAGGNHSLTLDSTGGLCSWGSNNDRQCSVPTLAPGERWAAMSAGYSHSLGLTQEGALHCWGNRSGQRSALALELGERWVVVSAGGGHSLGLTTAGALHAWGSNNVNQCGVPALPPGERWATVSAGGHHSMGLTVKGALHAWGHDGHGQCTQVPTLPEGECWAAVSAGGCHNLGLTATGQVYTWGRDNHRQCSDRPTLAAGEHWAIISAGEHHSLGVTSAGALHAWGANSWGQCNVPPGERWRAASAGAHYSVGITSTGVVWAWGLDNCGQVSLSP